MDQTKKKLGPQCCQKLRPQFEHWQGVKGWQAGETVKFRNGRNYLLSEDMESNICEVENKLLKKYEEYSSKFERLLLDRISILQNFLRDMKFQLNYQSREQLLDQLRTNGKLMSECVPSKYAKLDGMRLFEVVEFLERDAGLRAEELTPFSEWFPGKMVRIKENKEKDLSPLHRNRKHQKSMEVTFSSLENQGNLIKSLVEGTGLKGAIDVSPRRRAKLPKSNVLDYLKTS